MTTVRQHMKVFHDGAAAHWQSTAAHHEKEAARNAGFAKCYASMAKTADSEAWNEFADEHGQAAKDHEQYAKLCADYSAFHETCASDCEKSEQDQLGKTLRPDPYTSITPRDTPFEGFGIRAIPRAGGPTPAPAVNKAIVPIELQHMLGGEADEQ